MSISVFCVFLSACNAQVAVPELDNKTETSNHSSIISLDILKAFPTAEGAGASASGGRNGEVVYVTNTNQSGAGSLKSALLDYGNRKRTILFAVGGRFDVSDWNYFRNTGNFTLAGQTANELGGVHLVSTLGSNGENGSFYLKDSEDMIIRYLSAKGGWQSGTTVDQRRIAFVTTNSTRVIYDHYSSGFSSYLGKVGGFQSNGGDVTTSKKHGDITFQYSLGHEGISGQNVGFVLGDYWRFLGGTDSENTILWNEGFGAVDFHHNAFLNMTHRQTGNIYAGKTGKYRRVSNYINGVGYRLDSFVGTFSVDYINNIYEETKTQSIDLGSLHKLEVSYENKQPIGVATAPSMYFSGNQVIKTNGSALIDNKNQWSFVSLKLDEATREEYSGSPIENLENGDLIPTSSKYRRNKKLAAGRFPISKTPPGQVKSFVLAHAGAGVRFNDDGSTYNVDKIDKKYIDYAINGGEPTFYSSSLGDGGLGDAQRFYFPHYPMVKVDLNSFDKDRNGLPDAWEKKHKVSNANGVKVNWNIQGYSIKNNAGYTNLEMYLAELAGDFHMLAKKK